MGALGTTVVVSAPNNQPFEEHLSVIQSNSILTQTQVSGKSLLQIEIETVAEKYGLSGNRMIRLANCESSLNQNAIGDSGRAVGLYQFHLSTWNENCKGDRNNQSDQIACASRMISSGMASRWSCKY